MLHNDAGVAGQFSPMIIFSGKEATPSQYKAAMAGIYARSPLGTGNVNDYIDGELIFATAGAATKGIVQRMVINKEGLVGIGTTSPSSRLEIKATSATHQLVSINRPNSDTAALYIGNDSASPSNGIISSNHSDLIFGKDQSSTLSEWMRIKRDGNVGINVTNPLAKLHVLGSVILDSHSTTDPDSGSRTAYPAAQMLTHYNEANGVSIIGGQGGFSGTGLTIGEETTRTSNFKFIRGVSDTNGGGNAAEEFWVNGIGGAYFAGDVGVGTASPVAAFQVGSITATAMSQVVGKARIVGTNYIPSATQMGTLDIASTTRNSSAPFNQGFGPSLTFSQNISGYVDGYEVVLGAIKTISTQSGNTGQEAAMTFLVNGGTSTGIVERMRIAEDGKVGIGTTNPAQNFVVADATNGNGIELVPGATATIQTYNRGTSSYNNLNIDTARAQIRSFTYTTINTGSALAERMRINSSGEVLVGVTSNQTESKLTSRQNGSSIEFGHLNQSSGYYGTLGAMYSSGRPFLAFSCDSSPTSAGNNFATRGFKGNVIFSETNGNLKFAQATNANSTSQALTDRMAIKNDGAVQFNAYDSTNNTGTPTYLLGTDASGNVVKTNSAPSPITSQAASLYDLIPNGAFTTTYAFTSTAGTYAKVMQGDDVITANGTYTVQMFVSDYAVGGTQYLETYSGIMSWGNSTNTNDTGGGTISEIVLHRSGHAANQGMTYLRTRETTSSEGGELRLEIMCNKTYTGASNVVFKFVRLI